MSRKADQLIYYVVWQRVASFCDVDELLHLGGTAKILREIVNTREVLQVVCDSLRAQMAQRDGTGLAKYDDDVAVATASSTSQKMRARQAAAAAARAQNQSNSNNNDQDPWKRVGNNGMAVNAIRVFLMRDRHCKLVTFDVKGPWLDLISELIAFRLDNIAQIHLSECIRGGVNTNSYYLNKQPSLLSLTLDAASDAFRGMFQYRRENPMDNVSEIDMARSKSVLSLAVARGVFNSVAEYYQTRETLRAPLNTLMLVGRNRIKSAVGFLVLSLVYTKWLAPSPLPPPLTPVSYEAASRWSVLAAFATNAMNLYPGLPMWFVPKMLQVTTTTTTTTSDNGAGVPLTGIQLLTHNKLILCFFFLMRVVGAGIRNQQRLPAPLKTCGNATQRDGGIRNAVSDEAKTLAMGLDTLTHCVTLTLSNWSHRFLCGSIHLLLYVAFKSLTTLDIGWWSASPTIPHQVQATLDPRELACWSIITQLSWTYFPFVWRSVMGRGVFSRQYQTLSILLQVPTHLVFEPLAATVLMQGGWSGLLALAAVMTAITAVTNRMEGK